MNKTIVGGLLAFTALVAPAEAIEPQAAAEALFKSFGSNELRIDFGSAEEDGDAILIEDIVLKSNEPIYAGTIAQVRIEGVSDREGGGFEANSIVYSDLEFTGKGEGNTTIPQIDTQEVVVPSPAELEDVRSQVPQYARAEIGKITVNRSDLETPITVSSVVIENRGYDGMIWTDSSIAIEDLSVPVEGFDSETSGNKVAELGYSGELVADVTATSTADMDANTYSLSDVSVAVEDVGTLKLDGSFANLNYRALIDFVSQAQGEDSRVNPMALMPVLLAAAIEGITISYEDASVADRIVEYRAKEEGVDRAEVVEQFTSDAVAGLEAFKDQPFVQELTAAIRGFLEQPETITLKIDPDQPVSLAALFAAVQTDPTALPELLSANVVAE